MLNYNIDQDDLLAKFNAAKFNWEQENSNGYGK